MRNAIQQAFIKSLKRAEHNRLRKVVERSLDSFRKHVTVDAVSSAKKA